MNRVDWNGLPLEHAPHSRPVNLRETIFDYLPPPVPITPVIEDLAQKYLNGQITGPDYGLRSIWPGSLPDYSKWTVDRCAGSIEEWLYHYFLESAEHDRRYIERLRPYHQSGLSG